MRKIYVIVALILSNFIGYAQERVDLQQVEGVYVMVLSSSVNGFKSTESIRVPKDVLEKSTGLTDRIKWVITQSNNVKVLVTRDGINFQLVTEWNGDSEKEILSSSLFSKPVLFLSEPQHNYQVVKVHKIEVQYFSMPYYEIAKSFVGLYPNLDYDAIIISDQVVKYIKF